MEVQCRESRALCIALEQADGVPGGFSIAEVSCIEACWLRVEDQFTSHGFVLALIDGGRRYLGLELDESCGERPVEFDILTLAKDATLAAVEGVEWDTDPTHLNVRLAELKRQ